MTWRAEAACRGADSNLFFPEAGDTGGGAKAICAGCAVRAECLEEALSRPERRGVWGGMTPAERTGLYRQRKPEPPEHGTTARYDHHGCRCDACRAANKERCRSRRRRSYA